jgi:septation ring formation regulator EzrA
VREQQRNPENIAALKVEISDLQRQVTFFEKEVSLPGCLEGRCDVSKENDQIETMMKQLNHKLNEIQMGLLEIEDERENFSSNMKQLQRDKKSIELELAQREKEIATLSRRCSMQADISKNTTHLLSMNKELSKKIVDLENDIRLRDETKLTIDELKIELDATKKANDQLERKAIDITNDHEAMSEKLRSCLETCEQLTLEKLYWEKECQ